MPRTVLHRPMEVSPWQMVCADRWTTRMIKDCMVATVPYMRSAC